MLTSYTLPLTLFTAADGSVTAYRSRSDFEHEGGVGPTTQAVATYYLLPEGGHPTPYPTPGFTHEGVVTTSFWAESAGLFYELPDAGWGLELYPTREAAEAAWPSEECFGYTELHLTREAPELSEEELAAEAEAFAAAYPELFAE